ncbi:MAG: pyridoxine 5'-phosphate synthase [Phycisphaerae bacterium]|nr:pyridoxine 5'-phosphate synthase [Phycisphaerae bacterium]MDD5382000.1 pyridoxine 5'-phosphate synthase [Phycisphaerae bacterium]
MTKLSVNLNKIALLRNQRDIGIPSVTGAAKTVIKAGAHGITVHPRPDERHIKYADVYELARIATAVEFNIEGNPFLGRYMEIVCEVGPSQATLVPDTPEANTSDHGWNLKADGKKLTPIIKKLQAAGIRVSLFMAADAAGVTMAKEIGADRVELYTEPYASAFQTGEDVDEILQQYAYAARAACDAGLGVNAGHDLNLDNLGRFLAEVPGVLEVSIGHALIADALETGLSNTVQEYLKVLNKKR